MDAIDIITNAGAYISLSQVAVVAIGLIIGTIIGVLPGIGPLLGVTLAIPFTFAMSPVASLALLIGIYQGGSYGGAISAALLGIPGTPLAAATLLDAYPMAKAGQASQAVSLATVASWLGGIVGGIVLLFFAPLLAAIAIKFGPAEKLGLALLGLTAIATLSEGSTIKGLLSGALGLLLATVGVDPFTSIGRFNFGFTLLTGGLTFVSLLVGLFAISEVLIQIETGVRAWDAVGRVGFTVRVMKTIVTDWFGYLRASITGVIIGVIPGIGGVTSSFLAYKLARDFSKSPERFGKGEPKGVIATESANSATTGGALIPMLAIGIPGDPIVAVMMGGLLIHGLSPGATLFFTNIEVLNGIFAIFLVGAVLLLPIGWVLMPFFARLLRVPHTIMIVVIVMLCIFGTYAVQRQVFDLWVMWVFGIAGYAMRRAGIPLSPLVIGFVLGPVVEVTARRLSTIAGDDPFGFLLGRPSALIIFLFVIAALVFPILKIAFTRHRGGDAPVARIREPEG